MASCKPSRSLGDFVPPPCAGPPQLAEPRERQAQGDPPADPAARLGLPAPLPQPAQGPPQGSEPLRGGQPGAFQRLAEALLGQAEARGAEGVMDRLLSLLGGDTD